MKCLSRNLGHLMLLVDELERNRTEILFVNEPRENTPEGRMLLQMRGMFAQYARTKIRERSRRGKERRANEGLVLSKNSAYKGSWYYNRSSASTTQRRRFADGRKPKPEKSTPHPRPQEE